MVEKERKITGVENGEIVKPMSISALGDFLGVNSLALTLRINSHPDLRDISFISRTERRIAVEDAKRIVRTLGRPGGGGASQ